MTKGLRPTPRADNPRHSLRRLTQIHSAPRRTDGGLWPHTAHLERELDNLIGSAKTQGFDTRRVVYRIGEWKPMPRRTIVDDVVIRHSGYRTQPPDTLTFYDSTGSRRLQIVVVPTGTDDDTAGRALTAAALEDTDDTDHVRSRSESADSTA